MQQEGPEATSQVQAVCRWIAIPSQQDSTGMCSAYGAFILLPMDQVWRSAYFKALLHQP